MWPSVPVLLLIAAVGGLTLASAAVASYMLSPGGVARRRLRELVGPARFEGDAMSPSLAGAATVEGQAARAALSRTSQSSDVLSAGYHQPWAPAAYRFSQLGLATLLGISTWLALGLKVGSPAALVMAVLGYLLPGLWIAQRIASRRTLIQNGLPDVLDLMVICLEAGSGIDAAIVKSASELGIAYPALAEELRMVTAETRAGKTRIDALRNLAARTKIDEVRALVAMLVQTDRFGTSIVQALRTHADVSRTKRRQRAEERGAKIGVKLVFPLVFFMFPALYVVVLGPVIIQFVPVLFNQVTRP